MINSRKEEKLYLEDFNLIIDKINEHFETKKGFILKDLLNGDKYNTYWIRDTRGYLQTLINFDYLEIFAKSGNNNYIYTVKKIIPKKYN